MELWPALLLILAFLGVFGLLESLVMLWRGRDHSELKRLRKRLQSLANNQPVAVDIHRIKRGAYSSNPQRDRFLKRFRILDRLDNLLRQSGKHYTVEQALRAMALCALLGLVVGLLLDPALSVVYTLVAAALPLLVLRLMHRSRMNKIEVQLPDALAMLSQAMRAGHAFSSAMYTVGQEGPEPICVEFRTTSEEISFGASVRDSILNLANRVDSVDMRFFAIAILIQSETGGNLSSLLQDLARLIRERLKLRRTIKVLSAEGRLSGWILGGLPFAFAGLMLAVNPSYLDYFWSVDTGGLSVLKFMGLMLLMGALWIKKITTIKL